MNLFIVRFIGPTEGDELEQWRNKGLQIQKSGLESSWKDTKIE
jgi:hypothetical protein